MKIIVIALTSALLLTACTVPVNNSTAQNATFPQKPSESDAMSQIRNYLARTLIDPDSLKLECSGVRGKGWARQFEFKEPIYGYPVICSVNAKNKFGGYTGATPYVFLFNNSTPAPMLPLKHENDHNFKQGVVFGFIE